MLEKDLLEGLQPHRQGRFRNFLLVSLKRYVSNQRRSENSVKRGGKDRLLSIDFQSADQRFRNEPAHDLTAERAFELDWAMELMQRSLQILEQQWKDDGKSEQFQKLKVFLAGDKTLPRQVVAEELGISKNALNVRIHRLMAQFRQILCHQIADTLGREDLLEDEINCLFKSFSP